MQFLLYINVKDCLLKDVLYFSIDKRRQEVLDRRQKVKDRAKERRDALNAAQGFQEFKRDSDEVNIYLNVVCQVLSSYSKVIII